MDPNFIHLDWERTFDALMLVAVIAIVVERGLSVVFQSSFYITRLHRDGMKESLALIASIAVCIAWQVDAMGMIVLTETTTTPGYIVTGALVAGGSKGSVKLFEDFFKLQSTAHQMRRTLQAGKAAENAQKAAAEVAAAPNKAVAEVARARLAVAVKSAEDAAAKAASEGRPVPTDAVKSAKKLLTEAGKVIEAMKE